MKNLETDIEKINNPFIAKVLGDTLLIDILDNLSSKAWGAWFGRIQYSLIKGMYFGKAFNHVNIFFKKCELADPLPLLSLLISLKEFKRSQNGRKVTVQLQERSDNVDDEYDNNSFLKYLAQEGFLKLIFEVSDKVYSENNELDRDCIKEYESIPFEYFFNESRLLPAQILDFSINHEKISSIEDYIEEWVDTRIEEIYLILSPGKVPAWAIDDLMTRIKVFLVETLSNVANHAYNAAKNSCGKYAGIYIRFREGLNIKSSTEKPEQQKMELKKIILEEEKNNPKLLREFIEDRPGAVEIFVIDAGTGLTQTLKERLGTNKKGETYKYPFMEAFKLVFVDGQRGQYREHMDKSRSGGLYLIGKLMEENKDFLWGRDDDLWVGTYFLSNSEYLSTSINNFSIFTKNFAEEHCKYKITGLSWVARFTWSQETEKDKKFLYYWKGEVNEHPVFLEFHQDRLSFKKEKNIYFEDYRFFDEQVEYPDYNQYLGNDTNIHAAEHFILLPKHRVSKASVWKMINNFANKVSDGEGKTLIIADIPSFDISTYINALNESTIYYSSSQFVSKFSKIILVTIQLGVSVLVSNKSNGYYSYEYDEVASQNMFNRNQSLDFLPEEYLSDILLWLRWHDSWIFWATVRNSDLKDQLFIRGKIKWDDNILIEDYLDFIQTLSVPQCIKVYRLAIQRTTGFFSEKECRINNIDSLTERLCLEMNAKLFPQYFGENILNVGSVFATGYTQKNNLLSNDKKVEKPLNVHFFKYPKFQNDAQILQQEICYLLLWTGGKWIEEDSKDIQSRENNKLQYERVGKTHVIAEGGYKYFKIPRFNGEGVSPYKRTPEQCYMDFQGGFPRLVKIGHKSYGGWHELISFNLNTAINYSFKTKSELALFLLTEVFSFLGGKGRQDLEDTGWWDEIEKVYEKKDREVAIVVYLSNYNNDTAVEEIKKCLSDELRSRILTLVAVNNAREGSTLLISPLALQNIENRMKQFKEKKGYSDVLIFDSEIVSGRTNTELKEILKHLGADNIITLTIIDRQRLPFRIPDFKTHRAYWRVDVPRLGYKSSCPVCKGLKVAKELKDELISQLAKDRIDEWQKCWGDNILQELTQVNGITSTLINLKNPKVEFGGYKIDLKKSIGLTLYTTEVHCMTSRNDLVLEYCRKEELNPANKIEIVASQLLLFGNEYSRTMHLEMLNVLFESANSILIPDNYSALAALVLFLQDEYIEDLVNELISEKGIKEDDINNNDIKIVLAYHCYHNTTLRKIMNYEKIVRLLKARTDIRSLYNQFHSEIYSLHGTVHSKPIPYLINKLISIQNVSVDIILNKLEDALNSIDQLIYILKEIPNSNFRKVIDISIYNFKDMVLLNLESSKKTIYENIMEINKFQDIKDYSHILKSIKDGIQPIYSNLTKLHSFLFLRIGLQEIYNSSETPIEVEIQKIISEKLNSVFWSDACEKKKGIGPCNKHPIVKFSHSDYQRKTELEEYFYWDRIIVEELTYLISNAIYSKGSIINPFVKGHAEKADMWIAVYFKDSELEICFANQSDIAHEIIVERIQKNKRFQQEHIEKTGSFIEYSSEKKENGFLVKAHLKIPYLL